MPRLLIILVLIFATPARAADSTTKHTLNLPAGPLAFTASVETIILANPEGAPQAEIVATAFLHEAQSPRPVTFALNGGPGASSAWLDVGAIGPWRVPVKIPIVPSQPPVPIDNAETWLPFTDLVFIDPVGTGYSRATGKDNAKSFYGVDSDIRSLATVVRRWLQSHNRLESPVFIAGESYGGFRAPRLARTLNDQQGVGVSGLVMISPVLDFNGRDAPYDPLRWVARLPSLAAAARNAATRAAVADAETYARTGYLTDLLRGPKDPEAVASITDHVARLTGLDRALVRRREGRIGLEDFLRDRNPGEVASPYDATIAAADPFPAARDDNSPDAILDGLRAPFTSAMLALYATKLDWQPNGAPNRQYYLLNDSIAREWDYGHGNGRPQSMTALRQYLALDPAAQAIVTHGITDLVTPYFASALLIAQVPETKPAGRLGLRVYPGGHMSYLRDDSRQALRSDAEALINAALAARK